MASLNRKIVMQLNNSLGNRTNKECWHIIKLRLIAWIIGLYLIILECPLGCVYDCVCGAFCVPSLPVHQDTDRPEGASLQGNGWICFPAGALIKFTEQFSGSTIKFSKLTIILGGCWEKKGDTLEMWPGVFVLSLWKTAPSKWNRWKLASAQLLFH